jgi:hypothetical protein
LVFVSPFDTSASLCVVRALEAYLANVLSVASGLHGMYSEASMWAFADMG